ncbi:unnamed protein product, partial [Timema podura]|nr:unnamed protein product [Timema podura]
DELNVQEYMDVSAFEICETESMNDIPFFNIKQEINTEDNTFSLLCNEPKKQQNVVDSSNYNETKDCCITNQHIDINELSNIKEFPKYTKMGGRWKRFFPILECLVCEVDEALAMVLPNISIPPCY